MQAFATLEPEVREAIAFAVESIRRVPRGAKARGDVAEGDPARRVRGRAHDADPVGRLLRAARQGRLPLGHDDDHDPGGDRGRAGDRRADPADAGRRHRCGEPGRRAHGGRRAGLQVRRRASRSRRPRSAPATIPRCVKIVGPGEPLGGGREEAAGGSDRHGPAGRAQRIDRARRCQRQRPDRRARSAGRGRARPRQLGLFGDRQPRGGRGGARRDPGLLAAHGRASASATPRRCSAARAAASCWPPTWTRRSRSPTTTRPSTWRC